MRKCLLRLGQYGRANFAIRRSTLQPSSVSVLDVQLDASFRAGTFAAIVALQPFKEAPVSFGKPANAVGTIHLPRFEKRFDTSRSNLYRQDGHELFSPASRFSIPRRFRPAWLTLYDRAYRCEKTAARIAIPFRISAPIMNGFELDGKRRVGRVRACGEANAARHNRGNVAQNVTEQSKRPGHRTFADATNSWRRIEPATTQFRMSGYSPLLFKTRDPENMLNPWR